jgi:hypothetical protein
MLAGIDYISAAIGARRLEHAAETLSDAADEAGARTAEEFVEFVRAAVTDPEHQELLARALTIAQDTAMRDKRRALGRALALATTDTGTKVDDELLLIRVLADLDPPHIRCLRIMAAGPPHLDAINRHRLATGEPPGSPVASVRHRPPRSRPERLGPGAAARTGQSPAHLWRRYGLDPGRPGTGIRHQFLRGVRLGPARRA